MLANSLKPHTVEISNELILSCSTARQKYRQHVEEAKKLRNFKKLIERNLSSIGKGYCSLSKRR